MKKNTTPTVVKTVPTNKFTEVFRTSLAIYGKENIARYNRIKKNFPNGTIINVVNDAFTRFEEANNKVKTKKTTTTKSKTSIRKTPLVAKKTVTATNVNTTTPVTV